MQGLVFFILFFRSSYRTQEGKNLFSNDLQIVMGRQIPDVGKNSYT